MLHYLTDDEVRLTLERLHEKLRPGAQLIVRVTIPLHERPSVKRFIELVRLKIEGIAPLFRSGRQVRSLIECAGFTITCEEPIARGSEVFWFIAER